MIVIDPMAIKDANLVYTNVPEADYPAYSAATTYAVDAYVIVVGVNNHKVYKSLVNNNTGNDPASSATKWLYMGSTNRWAMFDDSVGSQTTRADSISVQISFNQLVDSIALINISAAQADITVTVPVDGVVYSKTISLISTAGITDIYRYWFWPVLRKTDFYLADLPPYAAGTISIVLSDAGATVKCGAMVIGQRFEIGATQYGVRLGIDDYSDKTRNGFGQAQLVPRDYNRRGDFTMQLDAYQVEFAYQFLANCRARMMVWAGTTQYGPTLILGNYESFQFEIQTAKTSIYTLSVKGLT